MNATPKDVMTAKLFLNAVFPVMQVLLDDDPKLHAAFQNVTAVVQFGAKEGDSLLACHLLFDCGQVTVAQGPADQPDLTLDVSNHSKMNALLRGGLALPSSRGRSCKAC